MKFYSKAAICVLVYIVAALCLFSLRTIPVSKIWDNYNVIYVSTSLDEESALKVLEDNGCRKVIALSRQVVPAVDTKIPVQKNNGNNYLNDRLKYFSDKSGKYRVFYIPSAYDKNGVKAVNELNKKLHVSAGMDFEQTYPWAVPLICSIVFCVLAFFAPNTLIYVMAALFPLMLSFVCPMYPVAASVCLLMLSVFMAVRVWDRKDGLYCLLHNPYFLILVVGAEIIAFIDSVKAGLILLVMDLVLTGLLIFVKYLKKEWDKMHSFNYEKILTARAFPVMYKKNAYVMALSSVPLAVILLIFAVKCGSTPKTSGNGIQLPVPCSERSSDEEMLPVAMDYYKWFWSRAAFPYLNLNENNNSDNVKPGDEIKAKRYLQTSSGITETEEVVMTFDEKFFASADKAGSETPYASIEEFLTDQSSYMQVKYKESTRTQVENQSIGFALILICMAIPLVLCACFMVFGKKRYENGK